MTTIQPKNPIAILTESIECGMPSEEELDAEEAAKQKKFQGWYMYSIEGMAIVNSQAITITHKKSE